MKLIISLFIIYTAVCSLFVSGEFKPGVSDHVTQRNLVKPDLTSSDVLDHHDSYHVDTHIRHFGDNIQGVNTLAYITPWNTHGYQIAKQFALKFTHLAPVWFQLKLESYQEPAKSAGGKPKSKIRVRIEGGHNVQTAWMKEVREAGSNHETKTRLAIVPRFLMEPSSPDIYIKIAQRPGLQQHIIQKVVAAVKEYDLDGLVLEMTDAWAVLAQKAPPKLRNELNAFVIRLGSALHEAKQPEYPKQLILVVRPMMKDSPYFQQFDFQAVHKFVDGFSLMTYDHPNNAPGPNSPLSWVRSSVEALVGEDNLSDQLLMRKVMMGIPFYGYRFRLDKREQPQPIVGHEVVKLLQEDQSKTAKLKYHEQWSEHSITLQTEGNKREQIFYPTLLFIQQRLDLAKELGCSISIWEIGQGMDVFYDLL